MFKRFYSFGCSWTNFIWPTWADIVAWDLEVPFENWGITGSCNQVISSKLVECDLKNTFTTNDLIVVVWSGWNRESRYKNKIWHTGGNIFNSDYYDQAWLKKYWDYDWDIIRNSTIIHNTSKAYKDMISYQCSIFPFPDDIVSSEVDNSSTQISNFYKNKIVFPTTFKFTENCRYNGNCRDTHPDILAHLDFVENQLYPALGINTVKQSTKNRCWLIFDKLASVMSATDSRDDMDRKIRIVLKTEGIDLGKHYGL